MTYNILWSEDSIKFFVNFSRSNLIYDKNKIKLALTILYTKDKLILTHRTNGLIFCSI